MFDLSKYLRIRAKELEEIIAGRETSLKGAPIGNLLAENRPDGPVYYYSDGKKKAGTREEKYHEGSRRNESIGPNQSSWDSRTLQGIGNQTVSGQNKNSNVNKGRKYLHKDQFNLAKRLAQRDYDKLVLNSAEGELRKIERLIASLPQIPAEGIWECLKPARKVLVDPFYLPDDVFIRQWEEEEYTPPDFYEFHNEIFTLKGERVRSKSEKIIADMLKEKGIPYKYEKRLYLPMLGDIYPDFSGLHVIERRECYIEHLGMMDNPDYAARAIQKIAAYEAEGIYLGESLLITYETSTMPLNTKLLDKQLNRFFGLK